MTQQEYENKIKELEQQLAEKKRKIKMLKLDLEMYKSVNEFLNRYGIEKAREVLLQTEKTKNQDKIEFAIEKFKWFKEKIDNVKIYKIDTMITHKLSELLDQQIKELKVEK